MKRKCRILYLPVAEEDLAEIVDYIRADRPAAAEGFLERFDTTVAGLADFPLMGRVPADDRLMRLGYRMLVVDDYIVFYVVKGNIVEIRRVLHGRRRYSFLDTDE